MFSDPILIVVNIILSTGVVLALIAAPMIKKGNRELHARNMTARRMMSRMYGLSESQGKTPSKSTPGETLVVTSLDPGSMGRR